MNKPHLFKHNGVWLVREEVDPENQEHYCEGCIGLFDERKCEELPGCRVSTDNEYGRIDYIFKEIQK